MLGKVKRMEGHLRQRIKHDHRPRRSSSMEPRDPSEEPGESPRRRPRSVSSSFRASKANPQKEGLLDYKVRTFWRRDFFRLHGHYLSYSRQDEEVGGAIDLWLAEDMQLDATEVRLTLNPKAMWRNGVRGIVHAPLPTRFTLRAASEDEARAWLEGIRQAAVRNDSGVLSGISTSPTTPAFTLRSVQLQRADGGEVATLRPPPPGGGKSDRIPFGGGLDPGERFKVQVMVEDSRGRKAAGMQTLSLEGGSGDLTVPVTFPTGAPRVRLRWVTEPTKAGLLQASPTHLKAFAAAAVISFLISFILFLAVVGVGGYLLTQRTGPPLLDCYLTSVTVDSGGFESPRNRPPGSEAQSSLPTPSDESITAQEMVKIAELREMVQDLKAPGSGVAQNVFEKHVNTDFRLVRFVRARPTVPAAADMVRESLRWRTECGADDILRTWQPPDWVLEYFGAPVFLECLAQEKERLPYYQRDKSGHLTVYWRGGVVDYKNAWTALGEDLPLVQQILIWVLEMLRDDTDRLHEQTKGACPSYLTFVYDLEGYEYSNQMPVSSLLAVANQFFSMLNVNYPEFIHRILIVRAPWLFSSLWAVIKPIVPKEFLHKMPLSGGGDPKKVVQNLTPTIPLDQIPKFLGGSLVDAAGDPECRRLVGPQGPFRPDKGKSCLQGAARGSRTSPLSTPR